MSAIPAVTAFCGVGPENGYAPPPTLFADASGLWQNPIRVACHSPQWKSNGSCKETFIELPAAWFPQKFGDLAPAGEIDEA